MARSRLTKNLERQTEKNIALAVGGIIVLLFLLIKFGYPALTKFAYFLSQRKEPSDTSQNANTPSFVAPPVLNDTFSATNSAQITVSGQASGNEEVRIYVNNSFDVSTIAKADGTFTLNAVDLSEGANSIKAKAVNNSKTSDYSNEVDVTYSKKAPNLTISSPSDGQTVTSQTLTVTGSTDSDASLTINDHVAIVNSDGSFTYTMQLQNGDNQIKIIATDSAGNKTEKDLKVTFSQ